MKIHAGLSVDAGETWSRRDLKGLLREKGSRRELSDSGVRAFLAEAKARGMVVIPIDCPTPNPDGTCPGHETRGAN